MKHFRTSKALMCIAGLMQTMSSAQDAPTEPIELTRLREQFSNRIDQEMKPWRERYAQELQKLADRLIKERKLAAALAVEKEKEKYLTVDLSKKTDKPAIPATAEEARDAMNGTVWLVYSAEDKKRENLLDTYHFVNAKSVYALSTKQSYAWSAETNEKIVIAFVAGNINVDVYFDDASAESKIQDRRYNLILVGKYIP